MKEKKEVKQEVKQKSEADNVAEAIMTHALNQIAQSLNTSLKIHLENTNQLLLESVNRVIGLYKDEK